jgi:hypothetical protein
MQGSVNTTVFARSKKKKIRYLTQYRQTPSCCQSFQQITSPQKRTIWQIFFSAYISTEAGMSRLNDGGRPCAALGHGLLIQ